MSIKRIEIVRAHINLVSPFRTSFGTEVDRELLYVHVIGDDEEGWGECVAMAAPLYSSEYVDGCEEVIKRYLIPLVTPTMTAHEFVIAAASIRGNFMAKAAVEAALLDYQLRCTRLSLAGFLGATQTRVASGVSVGIQPDIDTLLGVVEGYRKDGYVRIKLKIEPGFDIDRVRAVRQAFGDEMLLQVDANAAYTVDDAAHLARLDEFNLLLIEQPLPEEDIVGHVELSKRIATPVCLDESITSYDVARGALDIGACSIINIKPGRVGGYMESKRIHDLCYSRGVPVWCGGMLETGIGRAANLALAALPGFTLPGDTSASDRYFVQDVTEPFVLKDGYIDVPNTVGIGVRPLPDVLEVITSRVDDYRIG
ncbi:MAG: o-succinylbenzoate synthase [Actinobacteria bacterium]|uniref:o-succinylbenzoate synthase n=1 Tax=freshwater metagenome TaxID=449393 RepID=A0A6J6KIY9_9ZZZZ|nr:o-succinylbenzoate synthase [Actinomycetota bacterium]